ncbi:MAG: hypothetical protein ACPGWS_07980, partial [Solirubrobacterales bacterium]
MGKRSRRQQQRQTVEADVDPGTSRAKQSRQRMKARADAASSVAEAKIKERPKAPWDPFPLMELAIFSGIVLLIVGALIGGNAGRGLIGAGVVLACIGGLDTILREHFNGYRPHAGMLAGIVALLALTGTTALFTIGIGIRAAIAIGVFALLFPA